MEVCAEMLDCKRSAIQRGLEPERIRIAIVKAVARQLLVKTLRTGEDGVIL
jgi:hypothetical protein